ncbi:MULTISPECIES: prephenate dehydratase [unclassified Lentimicrobium]|uniref:prephenate dehydratase n=1 Tax=unclassified Lentimicrobium TaxID=2677434 RepID=UPI001556B757|nr:MULTISPECIES: prephenate dehydratase [unclassified Lentimicrobium]NPD45380.1 prephenate dehydratase [Lentimicrobium sp. S6]NPD85253.1 prephenate dehydratase [Lentimicrobium sp. L6]
MVVSIQGIKGAFHQEAAEEYFGQKTEILPQVTFQGLVDSVSHEEAEFGIMAIENTISGTIHNNFNLIRQANLQIIGEVYLRIEQNLVALPGTRLDQLTQVESHYMAINQCREFFRSHPHIKLVDAEDTAMSMRNIAENNLQNAGAIGSRLGAEQYGLEIIAPSIETNKQNYTRFLTLRKRGGQSPEDFNKASLALLLPHQQGSLAKILSIIDIYGVNLSKIESMPVIGEPWHYLFYIDVLFDKVKIYQDMLQAIRPLIDELHILGEYPFGQKSFNNINNTDYDTSK